MSATVAVILAAGGGSRYAGPGHKLDVELDGRPLLHRAVDAAVAATIGRVVVVVNELVTTPLPATVDVIANAGWTAGQMSSLRLGLDHVAELGGEVAVIGLGDQPGITPQAWRDVAVTDAAIAVATYDSRRGHPVRLHRDVWPLLPEKGDEGARRLMRLRPDLVREVPCAGQPTDIDTVEELRRWPSNS
ncbi:hypothetical protein BH24ACT5_BH24ACT5_28110 [soil metagenome]